MTNLEKLQIVKSAGSVGPRALRLINKTKRVRPTIKLPSSVSPRIPTPSVSKVPGVSRFSPNLRSTSTVSDLKDVAKTVRSLKPGTKFDSTAFKATAKPDIISRGISKLIRSTGLPGANRTAYGLGGFTKSPLGRTAIKGYGAYLLGQGGQAAYNLPDQLALQLQQGMAGNNAQFSNRGRNQLASDIRSNAFPVMGQMITPYVNPSYWTSRERLTNQQRVTKDQSDLLWKLTGNELLGRDTGLNAGTIAKDVATKGVPGMIARETARLGWSANNDDLQDSIGGTDAMDYSSRAVNDYLAKVQGSEEPRIGNALSTPIGRATGRALKTVGMNTGLGDGPTVNEARRFLTDSGQARVNKL
jgi:hypothetical protein